jgi:AraC-like DNA-binding protein
MMDNMSAMPTLVFSSYLTWSDDDEERGICCTDIGQADVPPGSPYPPSVEGHPSAYQPVATGRVLSDYQLVFVARGRGVYESEGFSSELSGGTVIALFPGVRHAYHPDPKTGWEEYWVGFKGAVADRLISSGFHVPSHPLYKIGLEPSILDIFSDIFRTVKTQKPFYQLRTGALILLLIAEIHALERKSEAQGDAEQLVERAKFLMHENIDGTVDIDGIGDRLGVGRARFYEAFKWYTGMTPYQYFIHLKINRAKEILASEGASVKEAAFRLGFDDQYYFSRLFRKKTGLSPSAWAEQRRTNVEL